MSLVGLTYVSSTSPELVPRADADEGGSSVVRVARTLILRCY